MISVLITVAVGLASVLLVWQASSRWTTRRLMGLAELARSTQPPPPPPSFARIGGNTVDLRDWSPDVIAEIRKAYFRPTLEGKYVEVADLTATCPRNHVTRDRVVVVCRDLATAKQVSAGILRSRAEIRCDECGKSAKLTAKSTAWEGLASEWDGSA